MSEASGQPTVWLDESAYLKDSDFQRHCCVIGSPTPCEGKTEDQERTLPPPSSD